MKWKFEDLAGNATTFLASWTEDRDGLPCFAAPVAADAERYRNAVEYGTRNDLPLLTTRAYIIST